MEAVKTISGSAMPLPLANVDTDQIIPKQFLKRVERSGFGEFLFYDWARDEEGELDAGFVLNDPAYAGSVVLVAGPNFGSGSSREHAPWAIEDWGFKAVVAPSFADIFYSNCTKIGLVPVILTDEEVALLTDIARDPSNVITVDLETQTVRADGFEATFPIDAFTKHCLLNGLDGIDLTLENATDIDTFEGTRPSHKPKTVFS